MRTKNFFKGLAVAAVALVGAFATSCSEENLNVNATGTPVELPAGVAKVVATVVDLGDMGIGAKVLATDIKDVAAGSQTIDCPAFTGSDEYVIPAAQTITVPALEKGQTLSIPVTFYVVKLTSAFNGVSYEEVEEGENPNPEILGTDFWGDSRWGSYYAEVTEVSGLEDDALKNDSEFAKDVTYTYNAKEGCTALEEVATSRLAATSDEDVIDAYVKNMTEWQDSQEEWEQDAYFTIPACSYAKAIIAHFYLQPVFDFTYGKATKSYTFKQYYGSGFGVTGFEEIPSHDHSHDHGHGDNGNAGGGGADAQ